MHVSMRHANWLPWYVVCVAALGACVVCSADDIGCQGTAGVPSPVPVQESFSNALKEITTRWKVAVVAEGSPVTGPADLNTLHIEKADNVLQAIERVAIAYDYLVEDDHPVYVLTKRFTSPDDIPDLTLEEARYSLNMIARLVSKFNPIYVVIPRTGAEKYLGMKNALSADQIAALATTGVPVSSLSETQRAEARKFAISLYIQMTANSVNSTSNVMDAICTTGPESGRTHHD